jgi:hypothetical protein
MVHHWKKNGGRVLRLLAFFSADPNAQIRKTKRTFNKYGLRCLLVAKFLPGIDVVAPPLAGMSESSIGRFLVYDSCVQRFGRSHMPELVSSSAGSLTALPLQ